jgi:uncharacterized membrane protein
LNPPNPQEAIQRAARAVIADKNRPASLFGVGSQLTIHQETGPLPAPEILKKYNEAVPDGAERIFKMAERDQKHIHRNQNAGFVLAFLGEILGWSIVVFALWVAYTLLMKDKPVASAVSFITAVGLLSAGYYERRKQNRQIQKPPENQK